MHRKQVWNLTSSYPGVVVNRGKGDREQEQERTEWLFNLFASSQKSKINERRWQVFQ